MALLDTKVTTVNGVVGGARGRRLRRGTISWRGIPFAAPPVAHRRFCAPEPAHDWPGVRDCTKLAKAAIQEKRFTAVAPGKFAPMAEDCLTLNVFSPDVASSRPRPVMVFIHGGAFILGTAATPLYDGAFLARAQDVVVVTIQYRFGPFGFLDLSQFATDDRPFDTNAGLRDQIAALRWVQDNIAAFGGDPDNVTVFGESAGGSSVLALLSAPEATGLFHHAIAQSPAPELVVEQDAATVYADEFVRILRDPQRRNTSMERTEDPLDPAEAQRLLTTPNPALLLEAGNRLMRFATKSSGGSIPFAPVVDGDLLPRSPLAAAADGLTLPVPLVIGSNKDEGRLFAKLWNVLPDSERMLMRVEDEEVRREIAAHYSNGDRDRIRLAGDSIFWAPMSAFADGHSKVAPTYVYRYDYRTKVLDATGFGATHATELFTVFGAYRAPMGAGLAIADWPGTRRVTDSVQGRWAAFARTGDPGLGWPAYTTAERKVLVINDPDRVVTDPDTLRRQAWNRVHAPSQA
ncbi:MULTISPECIES: carboxylesterase/lipase family protein [Gordonia]|uniref:Carboxylic ester hydrolase n=1 Tax=Gordonia amicalis TaxID=89053 RepID=A0AAE4U6Z1_9ACTN|nr:MULTISPECIES: carboxylesterase/lipase family protein [Gordonia]ATD69613.1 carboxylesterase/lipase family protein [Gordonia sp. 1D]KAF0970834.1 Para-nitrobenzyl esterase [Gordonia sp. YY1]MCZ0911614.1 carboxylesterase/lipase family protein [Gordonia amicalis]MCZ4580737.1 carboxylesterase/lipase family protein [Gordonia amicalis]MCZ4649874.1 carboxylesterase/lipase family protein [Gordonia amicalis]